MLSRARAARLKLLLDPLVERYDAKARVAFDPVEAPRRYEDPRDQEVAGLLASAVAYGRADLFKPRLFGLLQVMGPSPAAFARTFDPARHGQLLAPFAYRFHLAADVGALLAGAGALLRAHGTLKEAFAAGLDRGAPLQEALAAFTRAIREAGEVAVVPAMGHPRALAHLLPDPGKGSASKRLLLYLRWMVRRDGVDLGAWSDRVSASNLVIPLDTHVLRISRLLGLTTRRDPSWRTAEEVTASLRLLDAGDPVRYDFVLCHLGMSGACPSRRSVAICRACPLRDGCAAGRVIARDPAA